MSAVNHVLSQSVNHVVSQTVAASFRLRPGVWDGASKWEPVASAQAEACGYILPSPGALDGLASGSLWRARKLKRAATLRPVLYYPRAVSADATGPKGID